MSKRTQCRFFNTPAGCRKGANCNFLHTHPAASGSSPPHQTVASTSTSTRPTDNAGVPRGSCIAFWKNGDCYKGFDCRYKHDKNPSMGTGSTAPTRQAPSTSGATAPASLAAFLTNDALARLAEPGSDALFSSKTKSRTPSEVHNHLKRFLSGDYRFRYVQDIYAFTGLLVEASTNNSLWSSEDGQLLLTTIGKDNGLLRVNDVLTWQRVAVNAGNSRDVLSFQRGYIPLLQYLSSDFVVKSIMSHLVNALYMVLMEHFGSFAEKVKSCMETVTTTKTFSEPGVPKNVGGSQVFGALAIVLFQCLTRIKNATAKYPELRGLVLDFSEQLDIWIAGVSSTPPSFIDPLNTASSQAREQICAHLRGKVDQIVSIVDRAHNKIRHAPRPVLSAALGSEGILAALHNSYVGPGELRAEGPRHDNDFVEITDTRIVPTHGELVCRVLPFLPANIYGAPHPLAPSSPEQLLDIQFRLLREELTAPLRSSVQQVLDDLQGPPRTNRKSQLAELMKKGGGKYRGISDTRDNLLFNLYTNVEFTHISADRRGIFATLALDTPPGRARAPAAKNRIAFWEGMSGKRLMSGGLVALVWQQGTKTEVHLGVISSSIKDITESARQNAQRISIRVVFFDPAVELDILHELQLPIADRLGRMLLIEATVMFASIRPFLEALRVEPTSIPFMKYLALRPEGELATIPVEPPLYARSPAFFFQMASLFDATSEIDDLKLSVSDPNSVQTVRELLRTRSRLDPSQADAVIDSLMKEFALIQGPPGTGKSYTGVELLRILLKNNAGPILMIAFTNHALDHLLCSVLDANITQKIVRLGSRSADERISKLSLEAMEQVARRSRLGHNHYHDLKRVEEELKKAMEKCVSTAVSSEAILSHLEFASPLAYNDFVQLPPWIDFLYLKETESSGDTSWTRVGQGGQDADPGDATSYGYWLAAYDLVFLEVGQAQLLQEAQARRNATSQETTDSEAHSNQFNVLGNEQAASDGSDDDDDDDDDDLYETASVGDVDSDPEELQPEETWLLVDSEETTHQHAPIPSPNNTQRAEAPSPYNTPVPGPQRAPTPANTDQPEAGTSHPNNFDLFEDLGYRQIPTVPSTNRCLEVLLDHDGVWQMSRVERQRLHEHWSREVRAAAHDNNQQEFERLRARHADAVKRYDEGKAEARCLLLKNVDIIGCTTTGAANLTDLLRAIGPKVLLVEEAGQVLEAHVLGALVPSIQHTILIGDPLQLRPTLNNYALSMDNKRGGMVYKFDMSLMERLSSSGFPMSQIDVQRRMRPSISKLIRSTLYPKLQDHDVVKGYPPVRGMGKDVFFLSHQHKENAGEDESVSKYNTYEVNMISDLVMYLLRQGTYGAEGDIVVLCAYLGQLARVRDALADKVADRTAATLAVIIDERDQKELSDQEAEKDVEETVTVEQVKVSRRVRIRTIDNYQGEEAKIVILSLVRNSGGSEDERDAGHVHKGSVNVGFLKSENRTNVALSRAREGLYILGNAKDLQSQSKMWRDILGILEKDGAVGDALPIVCHRHRDQCQLVSKPGQLARVAPDGGCLLQCDVALKCGHLCPYKCHADDPDHLAVACAQRCTRLCPRGHPCSRSCADACGKCSTPIRDVTLPCGHRKARVPCAQLDDLSAVFCDVVVSKALPGCQHRADLRCSHNPKDHNCTSTCGGVLQCCGRDCKAPCFRCKSIDPAQDNGSLKEHASHPCTKPLYCQHECGKPCSRDHECETACKAICRQSCPHTHCRKRCSAPCAPCQESCTWTCSHYSCPVPCGSVCARLPCDIRCKNELSCGHRCPSVCGEDCSIQKCPLCASEDDRETIVDLILQRTMADVDPDMETPDDMLIAIPKCGHVFTLETLDGIVSITDYYDQDPSGTWIGLRTPPAGFLKPPTCPTCRAAITCPRYGRIYKRADLDVLENNIASHMSRSLARTSSIVAAQAKDTMVTRLRVQANSPDLSITKPDREGKVARLRQQKRILNENRRQPVQQDALDPAKDLHGIPLPEAGRWLSVLSELLRAYQSSMNVAETRSSHTQAWEASYTYLYDAEMSLVMQDPEHAPENPQEHAMRVARLRVGQPQPRADMRFLVEAFWMAIDIRLIIVELTKEWMELLCSRQGYPAECRSAWERYVRFVLMTCLQDARIALSIATQTDSHRQIVRTRLLNMRIDIETFSFNVDAMRKNGKYTELRLQMADSAAKKLAEVQGLIREIVWVYNSPRGNMQAEQAWLDTNFQQPSSILVDKWEQIERSLRSTTFYQPVSTSELADIVKSFRSEFTHTGHFYRCPNGHTYVIADCGGANQQAFCPECGAAIGGTGHTLVGDNTRNTEMEDLARAQGARASPWRWGV